MFPPRCIKSCAHFLPFVLILACLIHVPVCCSRSDSAAGGSRQFFFCFMFLIVENSAVLCVVFAFFHIFVSRSVWVHFVSPLPWTLVPPYSGPCIPSPSVAWRASWHCTSRRSKSCGSTPCDGTSPAPLLSLPPPTPRILFAVLLGVGQDFGVCPRKGAGVGAAGYAICMAALFALFICVIQKLENCIMHHSHLYMW